MKKLYALTGIIAGILLGIGFTVQAATILFPGGGGTGTSTPPTYGQMLVGTSAGVYQLQATSTLGIVGTGDGVGNWFTPQSWGNSTSTVLSFPGFISTASSTLSHLGTGGLAVNNGLIYNAATSTLSTITGTLSIGKGGTGLTSITGNRMLYSNSDGSALAEAATSTLNVGTATALAANGANCSAGQYPLGVNASGAVEDCTAANAGTVTSIATTYPITGGTITTTGTLGIAFGTTTANTWAGTQTFTKAIVINEGTTATSTFAGNVKVVGNLQVDGMFFAPVTLVTSGNVNIVGNLGVTGTVDLDTFTSAILLTGAGGDVAEYAGTSCTNQFVRSLSALGAATCASINNGDWSGTDLSVLNGGTGVSSFTANSLLYSNSDGTAIAFIATSTLNIGGNAGTATALAANGANCSAGNYPLGVNASGAVEDCTVASTGTVTSIATTYPITGGTITTSGTLALAFGTTTSNTWAGTQTFTNASIFSSLTGILKGNGSSALTVGANGTDYTLITGTTCSGTDKVSAVAANGAVTCSADTGGTTVGTVSTSTTPILGNLAYWTGTGYPSTLGTIATTSLSIGSEFSHSGTIGSLVGGVAGTLTLTANGTALTKLAQIAANTILGNQTGATGNVTALATSTISIGGNAGTATVLASDPSDCGANTWATTIAASGNLTCAAVTYAGITAMTSANFAGLISDETGTAGKVVFDTSPTLVTPILGYASSTQMSITSTGHLYIPNGANPSIASAGDLAINTTVASSSLRYWDGSAERSLFPDSDRVFSFASSTLAYQGGYGATGTTTILLGNYSRPITLNNFYCKTNTGTALVLFGDGTASTTYATCSTTGAGVSGLSNNTWTLRENFLIGIGSQTGTPGTITVTASIQQDAD